MTLEDLRRLYTDLDGKAIEALERHLGGLTKPTEMEQTEFEDLKRNAVREGHLTVTVIGGEGEQLVATSVDSLAEDKLPERIHLITFDSAAAMQAQNVSVANRFTLKLDFTEPPTFDSYNPWDQRTPNNSSLEVSGSDHTWVTAVYETTLAFLRKRQRRRAWLHSQATFNALNYLVGFPAAFWIVYRLDSSFDVFQRMHTALRGGMYVYIFMMALLVFRGIVWGFRWIFPVVEIKGARSNKIRAVIGTVLGSLMLAILYDVLRALLGP